jgi:hypothetical protein
MQWYGVLLAHIIGQFEIEVVCPIKNKRFERDLDKVFCEAVVVGNDKFCLTEIIIPPDPAQ